MCTYLRTGYQERLPFCDADVATDTTMRATLNSDEKDEARIPNASRCKGTP